MYILATQIKEFWKIAQATLAERQKEFQQIMSHIQTWIVNNNTDSINKFIKEFKDLLDQEKFNQIVNAVYRNDIYDDTLDFTVEWVNSLDGIDPKFKKWATQYLAELAHQDIMIVKNVLELEDADIFDATEMRKYLINKINLINQEESSSNHLFDLDTLRNSRYLSGKLIDRLLRDYAPWVFALHYPDEHSDFANPISNHKEQIAGHEKFTKRWFEKNEYTTDDIVYFMDNLKNGPTEYSKFIHVLNHARVPAQQLMRRGLYATQKSAGTNFNINNVQIFILDETLRPIDVDYRPLHVDSDALIGRITTANQVALGDEQNKVKWGQLFADLGIIAYPGTW